MVLQRAQHELQFLDARHPGIRLEIARQLHLVACVHDVVDEPLQPGDVDLLRTDAADADVHDVVHAERAHRWGSAGGSSPFRRRGSGRSSVVIADDSPLYRRGIARAVAAEPAMRLVGAVDGGETAVRAVETLEPDRLLADHPTRKVLLSSSLDADVERRARAAGVSACLPKHMSCGDICAAALALVRRQGRRLRSRRRVAEAMRRGLLD